MKQIRQTKYMNPIWQRWIHVVYGSFSTLTNVVMSLSSRATIFSSNFFGFPQQPLAATFRAGHLARAESSVAHVQLQFGSLSRRRWSASVWPCCRGPRSWLVAGYQGCPAGRTSPRRHLCDSGFWRRCFLGRKAWCACVGGSEELRGSAGRTRIAGE